MDNVDVETAEGYETNADVEDTEVSEQPSMRDALAKSLNMEEEQAAVEMQVKAQEEPEAQEEVQVEEQAAPVERIPLVPPSDMNKLEKEAFTNPTPENAHILQQYLNRRAYETRSDYQRKIQEVEQLKAQTSGLFDTLRQYEQDYAKQGISIADIAKRSVAWDKAMQTDPVTTAIEWLESYGLSVEDLATGIQPQADGYPQQQPSNYLTREEAERIAEEKLAAVQQQQQQSAVAYYNERAVESFMSGKPLFKDPETASQLEAEMAPIVQALTNTGRYSSPEEILETAYNYVVAGNPTFSSLNKAMAVKPAIEQKQAAVQKAKAAARTISGSAGTGTPRIQVKDIRDNLRRRMSGE